MNNKSKFVLSIIGVAASIALLVAVAMLTETGLLGAATAIVFAVISVVLVVTAIFFAAKVDYETGIYECRKCGNVFKPTFNAYLWGAHTLTTRYLKCPKCEEKSWCKRKITK